MIAVCAVLGYVLLSIVAGLTLARLFRTAEAVEDPGHVTGSDQLDS